MPITVKLLILFFSIPITVHAQTYFPERGAEWAAPSAEEVKLKTEAIRRAIAFAEANEYSGAKNLRIAILEGFDHEPYHDILGPTKERGGPAGIIIKNGYRVASWGDLNRVDMTFSVTKSYLSTVAGLAIDDGLIADVTDPVHTYVWDGTFDGKHNQNIQWNHLLNQSSDWSGELFGLKDWADRPVPSDADVDDWKYRELHAPGTQFKYNDVRVNVLAYALLQVWRQPLPQIMKNKLMDPIGASGTWRWFGYDHAWVNVDGTWVQSVTGGGHSGGGLFISTMDHARFGYLFLRNGRWKDKQLLSENWIRAVQEPSLANSSYGYMWWLNQGERQMEGVPDHVFYAAGFGGNFIIIDQKNDLLIVTRWLEPGKLGEFLKMVYAGL